MRTIILAALWLLLGIAVWSGMFDLYMARGAEQYLWRQSEFALHLTTVEPSMSAMMADAKRHGVLMSSIWALLVTGCGWATIWLLTRSKSKDRM